MTKAKLLLWIRDFFIVSFIVLVIMGLSYVFIDSGIRTQTFETTIELWIKNNYWNCLGLIGFAFAVMVVVTGKDG